MNAHDASLNERLEAAARAARAAECERMLRLMEHVVENAIPGSVLVTEADEMMAKVRRSIAIERERST